MHECNGNRDERTRDAIELLRQSQGQIDDPDIDQAVQAFRQYLDHRPIHAEHKRLAQNALGEPGNLGGRFGPLIGTPFSVSGLMLSGAEVIGRLWIFASGLTEPDQTNAKDSMISALKDSYDATRSMVCNDGKTQRLVIGVLQGRLAEVNVELAPEMQQISTERP